MVDNKQTEADVIRKLNKLLEGSTKREKQILDIGACVYTAGEKTYCAQLSKSDCDSLSGIWTKDGKCP